MEQAFDIAEREQDGVTIVAVSGEIDVATAPPLRERLQAQSASGHSTVVVDLSAVSFLDSTALGVLVGALKRCKEAGGDLPLVITEPRILKVFEITGLTDVFPIHSDVAAATAHLGSGK